MKFLFDDETFSFETLRTAGFALYDGADLGEVLVTASAITGGGEGSWPPARKGPAQRLPPTAEKAPAARRRVHPPATPPPPPTCPPPPADCPAAQPPPP